MHSNILSKGQIELLPVVKTFSREFYLVGGTPIALHLGHRQSIYFIEDKISENIIQCPLVKDLNADYADASNADPPAVGQVFRGFLVS